MKKVFLLLFILIVFLSVSFFFIKNKQKDFREYSFLNNKNHEYILDILLNFADIRKQDYMYEFHRNKHKKNYDERIGLYTDFLSRNKKINEKFRAELCYELGNFYFLKNDFNNALFCYKKALIFDPINIDIKYDIKILMDFVNKINVPEKLILHNKSESVNQLKNFVKDKEKRLSEKSEKIKNDLKTLNSQNIKLIEDIKKLIEKNKINIKQEINFLTKEKEFVEKQKQSLKDKLEKQDFLKKQSVKKDLELQKENLSKEIKNLIYQEKNLQNKISQTSVSFAKQEILKLQLDEVQKELERRYKDIEQLKHYEEFLQHPPKQYRGNVNNEIVNFTRQMYENIDEIKDENIYTLQENKKNLGEKLEREMKYCTEELNFWKRLESSVVRKVVKTSKLSESKTIQDKYFTGDFWLHKKNIWKNIIVESGREISLNNDNSVVRNISVINYKVRRIFNKLNAMQTEILDELITADIKIAQMISERNKQLQEEKENILMLLKDINTKKREIFSALNLNANSHKKRNLQKELVKMQEKEKALKQESIDCGKDLSELEQIYENIFTNDEIDILDMKIFVLEQYIKFCKDIEFINENVKSFYDMEISLLRKQVDILNGKDFNVKSLINCNEQLILSDGSLYNMMLLQKSLFEQTEQLLKNHVKQLEALNGFIDASKNFNVENFFDKLKKFLLVELNFFEKEKSNINNVFDFDKNFQLQEDCMVLDENMKEKMSEHEELLEEIEHLNSLFVEKEEKKVKSKKQQEKVIISKIKNYEVNTEIIKKEILLNTKKDKKKKKKQK